MSKPRPSARILGIGIDIVSLARIRQLFHRQSQSVRGRLCSSVERKKFSKKNLSPLMLSRLFAAKEAFFKALGKPWMGVEGFSKIDVEFLAHNRFVATWNEKNKEAKGSGCFFQHEKFVGAQVILTCAGSF